jgi:hypothetical protein
MQAVNNAGRDHTKTFNRVLYTGFLLIAAYFFFFKGDYGDTAMNLGIALVFDPFDPTQAWKERPRYQRAWLIVHVLLVILLFTLSFIR